MESQQEASLPDQINSEALMNENPKKFLEMLVRENKSVPQGLDEAIQKKYDAEIKNAKKKKEVKSFFGLVKDFIEESDDEEKQSYKEDVQKCLDGLYISENCKELYSVLYLYCQQKAPQMTLMQKISKEQKLRQEFQEISEILPLIDKKYQICHFMTIYEISQSQSDQFAIEKEFQNSGKIIGEKLIILLFDCIKRKVTFNQVIQMFTKINRECKITSQILFTYLYLHSNPKLRIFLFISCSQYMPLPLSLLNPWDIDKNTQMPKRIFFEELVYVFEKYNSVFQFKFLANQENQNVQNCTKIINQLYGKNFQTHQTSLANDGLVEIQFDNNCSHVQYLTVADAHGLLETEIIENFSKLFEILIIHTDKVFDENTKLKKLVENISCQNQTKIIIIIVHSDTITKDEKPTQINANIVQIKEQNKTFQNNMDNFIDQCLKTQQKCLKNNITSYLQDPIKRLENKNQYLKFLEQKIDLKYMQKHCNSLYIVENLIKLIIKQEDFTSLDFLPMVQYSQERCFYENQFQYESLRLSEQQNNENEEKYRDLKQKMSNQNLTELSQAFFEVIGQDLQLEILPILSLYVKGYLQTIKNPLEEQIALSQQKFSKSTSQQKELLEIEIKDLKKKINQKTFSQEHLIREIYELSIYSQANKSFYENQKSLTSQLYRDCQPLEIVNGETNKFISNIYERIFSGNQKQEVIVISVIGVQSAGKSLLLNHLFGTQFHSSAARCTKGVYATIIPFLAQDGKQKQILLLDTEGIQSQEKNDPQFDRKIIFFILSVSHVILLCNKQEMNKDMSEILKLVADQLVNAKQRNIHSPKVYIILNMLSQNSHQIRIECVQQLQRDLAIIDENRNNESLNQTLQIDLENVVTLQFAFERKNFNLYMDNNKILTNSVNIPQQEFQNEIYELRKAILNNINQYSQLSLYDWFEFAQENWKYTNSLRALENYVNIQQKQEDKLIKEIITELIYKHYIEGWKTEIKSQIDNQIKETQEKFSGGQSISLNIVQNSIQTKIDHIYQKISMKFQEDYQNECLKKKISQMIENGLQQIKRENYHYKYKAQAYSLKISSEFYSKKFQDVGDSTLQGKIKEQISQGKSFTEETAEKIFEEEAWPEALKRGSNILESEDQTKQRNIQFIGNQFSQVITIQDQEIENYNIQIFQQSNDLYELFTKLLKKHFSKQLLLMYIGDKKFPNFENILQFLGQEKQYLTNLPQNIYEKKQLYRYYALKRILEDCVNLEKLSQDINKCIQFEIQEISSNEFLQREEYKQKDIKEMKKILINEKKISKIFKELKNQLLIMGIDFSGNYQKFMPSDIEINKKTQDELHQIILKNAKMVFSEDSYFKILKAPPIQSDVSQNHYKYLIFEKQLENNQKWLYHQQNYIALLDLKYNKSNLEFKYIDKIKDYTVTKEMLNQLDQNIKKDLNYYLIHLADYKSTYASPQERKSAISFFIDHLNWNQILQQIDQCIIKNLLKIQEDQGIDNLSLKQIIQILQQKDDQSIEFKRKFNELEPKHSKQIIKEVKQIINKINEELEYFSLTISDVGMNFIYLIAQTGTFGLVQNLDLIKQIEPLKNIEKQKQIQKKFFIGMLTKNNIAVDQSLGEILAKEYSDKCSQNCKEYIIQQYNYQIDQISEQFQNIQLVSLLENQCLEINQKKKDDNNYQISESEQQILNELIELKINPRQLLQRKFESKFNNINQNLILEYMAQYQNRFNLQLQIFLDYLKNFFKLIQQKQINKTPANMLFVLDQNSPTKLNLEQHEDQIWEYQKIALSNYFKSIIRQEEFQNQKFQNGQVWLKIPDDYLVPMYSDINDFKKFNNYYQQIVIQILSNNDYITTLDSFVERVIMNLENFIIKPNNQEGQIQKKQNQQYQIKEEELLAKSKNKLMRKYLGCLEHCPLCRKQCDIDHQDNEAVNDEKHECKSGHQFQAFGGSKISENNIVLLESCDELKDQQLINHNGQNFLYKSFKEEKQFQNWIFDSANEEQVVINRQKNVAIWNLIGKELCKKFNQQGKSIIYHEAQIELKKQFDKTHYIFMLDASQSMRFDDFWNFIGFYTIGWVTSSYSIIPWDELMTRFKGFLQTLEYDINHKENSKISLITYEESSQIIFTEQNPSQDLLKEIKYKGVGFANFDNALKDAYKICQTNQDQYQNIVLYLLSDGDGKYNGNSIQNFCEEQDIMEKMKFYAIAFGNKANKIILQQMAEQFPSNRGKMIQALDTEELRCSFQKIIPNIYQQQ